MAPPRRWPREKPYPLPLHRGEIQRDHRSSRSSIRRPRSGNPNQNRNRNRSGFPIHPGGESGRQVFSLRNVLLVNFRSASYVSCAANVLWPVVPIAIAVHYSKKDAHLAIFILSYLAMIPCANLIGFAGQELARKVPHVYGVLIEISLVDYLLSDRAWKVLTWVHGIDSGLWWS